MAQTVASHTHTFRIPFWRMYLPIVVYAQTLYLPGMWLIFFVIGAMNGVAWATEFHFVSSLAGCVGVILTLMPAFWVYVRRHVVRVGPDTFTCSNGFGKLVTVPWSAITKVRPLYLPGLPYLMISTSRTRLKLWLPMFLRDMHEFVEKVERYAGGDHILYQELWPRVEQK